MTTKGVVVRVLLYTVYVFLFTDVHDVLRVAIRLDGTKLYRAAY